ncbi:MAG: flagellar hook assembly protein FlgD [Candidatus Zixiibacteriota bacterium]
MSTVSPVDQITTQTPSSTTDRLTGLNDLGKDDFLKLFVTRLANQDPLEPVKDEQFIAQLAQFTQLEQLYNMNENLENSLAWSSMLSQTINNTMATSLIGREVRVDAETVVLSDSGPATINYELGEGAANVRIEITDDSGSVVQVLSTGGTSSGAHSIEWDGNDRQGNRAPEGTYNLRVLATDSEGNDIPSQAYFSGVVDGVRYLEGNAMLLIGKAMVPLSNVIQVSEVDG